MYSLFGSCSSNIKWEDIKLTVGVIIPYET